MSQLAPSSRTVFRACVVNAVRGGEALMGQLVQITKGALTGEESSTRDIQRRTLVSDALRLLGQHEAALVKAYPMALLEIFAEGPAKSVGRAVEDTGMDFGELSLMDESEMHDQVELARAQQLAVHATDAVFAELNTLVSSAQGLRSVQPERNPLRPENYIRALQRVVAETGVAAEVRQLWMQQMREVLARLLVEEYKSAAKALRDHGVEPVGYAVLASPAGGRSGYGAPAHPTGYGTGYSTGYGGHSMNGPVSEYGMPGAYGRGGGVASSWQGESVQAPIATAAEEALLTVGILRQMLAGGGDPYAFDPRAFSGGQPASAHSAWSDPRGTGSAQAALAGQPNGYLPPAAAEAIEDMVQLERLVGRLSGNAAPGSAGWRGPGATPVAYAVPYMPAAQGEAYSAAMAVEVVGHMMANIAQDGRLLAPVQQAIQNLEPAIRHLVQHDGRFFSDEAHPARQLLDELTQRSLAFSSEGAPGFSQFMRLLNEAVSHLAATDIQDAGPFDTVLKALHAAWDAQEHKAKAQQQAEEARALQAEQREMLAAKIAADIRKLPDLDQVPKDVMDFVTGPWAEVVAAAQVTQPGGLSDGAADPGGYLALVPLLLWSAQPELTRAEPDRLTKAIPGILSTVRTGLKAIQYPPTQTSSFLQRLVGLHQAAFEKTAPAENPPESVPPLLATESEMQAIDISVIGPLDSAPGAIAPEPENRYPEFVIGAWVELITNRRAVLTQLTWSSPHGTLFLFTAADGSTQSMTRRMRDKLAAEGSLRVVPAPPRAASSKPSPFPPRKPGKSR
ncbi:conserved hypothetical protein [Acidovorax delafieldii 2AN]|uniref:Uncharacterized protein n=1 Tax=Acidovorax delafieldii 2AN TaxID=573060 RepID=C5T950_ACIDE|nr:DUF1631 family protein [Acidovorax delafieldii]EER58997.1 conserved hypothetical protein [Acidovorax delafieldii 2AN]